MATNNNRMYFAASLFSVAPESTLNFTPLHGLQSVGVNSQIQLEQIFELGQLSIYENKEALPTVNLTVSKVLDGNCPAYLACTQGATSTSLAARGKPKCNLVLGVFSDAQNSASGVPLTECYISGAFVTNAGYQMPVDGNFTESISLQAYDKIWRDTTASGLAILASGTFNNNDLPLAITGSGGVNRRQNFVWACSAALPTRDANGMVNTGTTAATQLTILPPDIFGISSSGTNDQTAGVYGAHVQDISVNVDFNRQDLFEQGRKAPYFKYVSFPVQVSTSIGFIPTDRGDGISFTQTGMLGDGTGNNLKARTIKLKTQEGTFIDLGTQNKFASVDLGGGDTGGGAATVTMNYITFNDFSVSHPQDLSTSLRQG